MAIPISIETERTLYLRGIVEVTHPQEISKWPKLSNDDLSLFGRVINLYSSIDFALNYVVQIMDDSGMLQSPWAGKTAKLSIAKVSKAIRSSKIWNESHLVTFDRIDENRRVRNMIAHFVGRRFPDENAYIFMTKSAYDFQQVYGVLPPLGAMLYGVSDATQMQGIIPVLEGLVKWASQVPGDLSRPLNPDVAE